MNLELGDVKSQIVGNMIVPKSQIGKCIELVDQLNELWGRIMSGYNSTKCGGGGGGGGGGGEENMDSDNDKPCKHTDDHGYEYDIYRQ